MRVGLAVIISALTMTGTSGCASLVHSGPREISIASEPPGAKVSIYTIKDVLVTSQTTPFVANLSPRRHFFRGQTYRVVFEKDGFEAAEVQLTPKVSAWYLGNLLVGGVPGLFIVDPATGAMFNLVPKEVMQTLTPVPSVEPATLEPTAPSTEPVPAVEPVPSSEPATLELTTPQHEAQ